MLIPCNVLIELLLQDYLAPLSWGGVRITELSASEPFDEVSLIMIHVLSKVSVGQLWREARQ